VADFGACPGCGDPRTEPGWYCVPCREYRREQRMIALYGASEPPPRWIRYAPVTCSCGARFTPLRPRTKYCSERCMVAACYARRPRVGPKPPAPPPSPAELERRRLRRNRLARNRRRRKRRFDPLFRVAEANHSYDYRKRKREG
jgi:hypothetical protein